MSRVADTGKAASRLGGGRRLCEEGFTLADVTGVRSVAISIALQDGVPSEAKVSEFVDMHCEPAGLTDDPDIRMARSRMDYIFRRLALDYLPYDKRPRSRLVGQAPLARSRPRTWRVTRTPGKPTRYNYCS